MAEFKQNAQITEVFDAIGAAPRSDETILQVSSRICLSVST